jgi:hypothetical protein
MGIDTNSTALAPITEALMRRRDDKIELAKAKENASPVDLGVNGQLTELASARTELNLLVLTKQITQEQMDSAYSKILLMQDRDIASLRSKLASYYFGGNTLSALTAQLRKEGYDIYMS